MSRLWDNAPGGPLTTGIGSLPHAAVDAALDFSFSLAIPFLPQLPARNPREFMITQALDGLPGLSAEPDGFAVVDVNAWENGTDSLRDRMEAAFRKVTASDGFESFEPAPEAWSGWRPFLYELEERKIRLAKIQIAGPMTCQWALKFAGSGAKDYRSLVGMQAFRLVLARALAMVKRVKSVGTTPLLFLDEPGFYGFQSSDPRHRMALEELRLFIQTLSREGALVGIHCCSNTDWPAVLDLPIDVLSLDAALSLGLCLSHRKAIEEFLARGSRFSLGLVPTGGHAVRIRAHRATLLVERSRETIESSLADVPALSVQILRESLLTPACGLALHTVAEAEAIRGELIEVGELLRASAPAMH